MMQTNIGKSGLLIQYDVECRKCGELILIEIQDANNVILVQPCAKCGQKTLDKNLDMIEEALKQKILAVITGVLKNGGVAESEDRRASVEDTTGGKEA